MSAKTEVKKLDKQKDTYQQIEETVADLKKIKLELRVLRAKKEKTTQDIDTIKRIEQVISRLEDRVEQRRDSLSVSQKNKIIKEQYRNIFETDIPVRRIIGKDIVAIFMPETFLREQISQLQNLEEKITSSTDTQNPQNSEDINEYFILLKKVNQFLVVLDNLKVNIPEPHKKTITRIQRGMIKLPVYGAEAVSKLFIRSKKEVNKRIKNVEHSLENYITFQGLESVRKTLLSVPSFFDGKNKEIEEQIRTAKEDELPGLYSKILAEPFEIIREAGLDPNLPENHPKIIYKLLTTNNRHSFAQNAAFLFEIDNIQSIIPKLDQAIHKHEIIASLLNMEFSYWRRFSLLNLETIKSTSQKMTSEVLRAITFDETQIVPSLIDLEKITKSLSPRPETDIKEEIDLQHIQDAELKKLIQEDLQLFEKFPTNDREVLIFVQQYKEIVSRYKNLNPEKVKKLILEYKKKIDARMQILLLNQIVESAIGETMIYDFHEWQVADNNLGRILNNNNICSVFTSYNRGLINSLSKEKENATVPRSGFAVLKKSENPERKFDVSLRVYNNTSRYNAFHSTMLECWIDSEGDQKRTKQLWEKRIQKIEKTLPSFYPEELLLHIITVSRKTQSKLDIDFFDGITKTLIEKYSASQGGEINTNHLSDLVSYVTSHMDLSQKSILDWWKNSYCTQYQAPSFEEALSRVHTLPCILLPSEISSSQNVNELQQELTQITNELRSQFVTASMLITYGVNQNGDFALSSSCDHSNWDGKQSGDMVEKVITKVIDSTKQTQLNQSEILQDTTTHVDTTVITSSEKEKAVLEQSGNYQIQSYVEAEGFVRICDDIGQMVSRLVSEGKINPDTKIKNPAVIMQLMLVNVYRDILSKMKDEDGTEHFTQTQNIGMLLGNPDITKDLDLAPIQGGFDLQLFNNLDLKQKEEYLVSLALLFDISLKHTNMELIKKVAESIPFKGIQNFLNDLSRRKILLGGLKDFAGEFMISNFGLPRVKGGKIKLEKKHGFQIIRNSGPAQTDFQKGSMTIVGALEMANTFYLSICYKNKRNAAAIHIAKEFKKYIESLDVNYYMDWKQKNTN